MSVTRMQTLTIIRPIGDAGWGGERGRGCEGDQLNRQTDDM